MLDFPLRWKNDLVCEELNLVVKPMFLRATFKAYLN
jgi:hypothetical protein